MQKTIKPIGYIKSAYKSKFGVPRQAGLIDSKAYIVLCDEFKNPDAFRGIEEFSHIWLLWEFSQCSSKGWSPTVRPPRLGGNKRVGVFATRSPFRPNSIGLSSVKLLGVDYVCQNAPVLCISGADLVDGTPIYDIKPYLPYTDCHTDATGGFTDDICDIKRDVVFECQHSFDSETLKAIIQILKSDPRPSYQNDKNRVYGMDYMDYNIRFKVDDNTVNVINVTQLK